MTEKGNKTKGGKEEYRKEKHDNEERKQKKEAGRKEMREMVESFHSIMINRMHKQCH